MAKKATGINIEESLIERIDSYAESRGLNRSEALARLAEDGLDQVDSAIESMRASPAFRAFAHLAAKLSSNPDHAREIEHTLRLALEDFDEGLFVSPQPA